VTHRMTMSRTLCVVVSLGSTTPTHFVYYICHLLQLQDSPHHNIVCSIYLSFSIYGQTFNLNVDGALTYSEKHLATAISEM
jgi:hypothetical protein